jgi:hypothetical protein
MKNANNQTTDAKWKTLYQAGALAPLITLAFYTFQMVIMGFGEALPATMADWFLLFQRNKILGLIYLNALDPFSIALLGMMFLALYMALGRDNQSLMAIAAFFAFLGIAVFVSTRAAAVSATLTLSDQYAAATTEVQKSQILTAGQAIHSTVRATPETVGFLFMAIAGLIISLVILRSETFGQATAYVGILGSVITLADHISLIMAPSMAGILMPLNGLLWLIWWLMISVGLFKLTKGL